MCIALATVVHFATKMHSKNVITVPVCPCAHNEWVNRQMYKMFTMCIPHIQTLWLGNYFYYKQHKNLNRFRALLISPKKHHHHNICQQVFYDYVNTYMGDLMWKTWIIKWQKVDRHSSKVSQFLPTNDVWNIVQM